jgi:hypothetical protein
MTPRAEWMDHLLYAHQLGGISDVWSAQDLRDLHSNRYPACLWTPKEQPS